MKRRLIGLAAITALLVLNSCLVTIVWNSDKVPGGTTEQMFAGTTIAVLPAEIELGSLRFNLADYVQFSVSVNGETVFELSKDNILKAEDRYLGNIGVLDGNILEKRGIEPSDLQEEITELWVQALSGTSDYNVAFANGFGEGNAGYLSNRPIIMNTNTYPQTVEYDPAVPGSSYFAEIIVVESIEEAQEKGADYILESKIHISNEVVEIYSVPDDLAYKYRNFWHDPAPEPGQYFFNSSALVYFDIKETDTLKVVVSEAMDDEYTTENKSDINVLLPVPQGNDEAYNDYMQSADLASMAVEGVFLSQSEYYYLFAPYYKTTATTQEVE